MTYLGPQAVAARDCLRSFERALADSRSQWDDQARHVFDRRHARSVVAAGRLLAEELESLSRELSAAVGSLPTHVG